MSAVEATYGEATARRRVASLPLSHLSVELGHLYREDFRPDGPELSRHFSRVAVWLEAAQRAFGPTDERPGRPRISTCFLVDDYFAPFSTPAVVFPALCEAAEKAGLTIDYIARESACATADRVDLARLVEGRIVPEPPGNSDGSRPPVTESGWLSNGERSPLDGAEAMGGTPGWRPPVQNSARRHSVFVDVELWSEHEGERTWSCAFLAAVWQLLRLGLLRNEGAAVTDPRPFPLHPADTWEDLPPIVQMNPDADPFSAYRTLSVLSTRFQHVEHAVRVILGQLAVDDAVGATILKRGETEGFALPAEIVDRINYVFDGSFFGQP